MEIILAGGTGQVGRLLVRALTSQGHSCVVLTRRPPAEAPTPLLREVQWDGRTLGPWCADLEGVDAVINLAGRSVDCRYTERNLEAMRSSRVDSTRVMGQAIAACSRPPAIWLQAGTATIYSHRFDAPNDEITGSLGGAEPGVPALWGRSVDIARAWEAELNAAPTPATRKVVLRSALTLSVDRGGVFDVLARLARLGVGRQGNGRQFVSWIHEHDFVAAVLFLLSRSDLTGAFNLSAPHPLPNRDFMACLHEALGTWAALPVPRVLLEAGALLRRTETELLLKSRRVVPTRLLQAGFRFQYEDFSEAVDELISRWRPQPRPASSGTILSRRRWLRS